MEGPLPLSPAELDALAASQTAAYNSALAAYGAAYAAYVAALAAYTANPVGEAPTAPAGPDPSIPAVIATYQQWGLAALTAAGGPVPAAQQNPSGAGWDVGTVEGGVFSPQYTSPSGIKARRLAFGWASAENGLSDVRAALGITIGQVAEPPIS
jgi:hypothetical protein